jgi:hypothetical protein
VAVDERGVITTTEGRLGWSIGAEDRWHHAAAEAAVRQGVEADGAIVETRMRIPGGDAIQRMWATVDAGRPVLVIEFENASPVPVALAVTGGDVTFVARREPSSVTVTDVDGAPPDSIMWPLPHRTRLRVAVAGPSGGVTAWQVDGLADPSSVASGWATHLDALARVHIVGGPEIEGWADAVRVLVLAADGPFDGVAPLRTGADVGAVAVALASVGLGAQAMALLDGVLHRQRRNGRFPLVDGPGDRATIAWAASRVALIVDDPGDWFDDHAEVVVRAADRAGGSEPYGAVAVTVALAALRRRGMHDAADHLERRVGGRGRATDARHDPSGHPVGAAAEVILSTVARLVREEAGGSIEVVPDATLWETGVAVEVHDLRTAAGPLSFGTRWHGERPALLWDLEANGPTVLTCGLAADWRSDKMRGETLLSAATVGGDRSE